MNTSNRCVLCQEAGGTLLWRNASIRVVAVDEPRLPGYTRVIHEAHIKEMSDLPRAERHVFMDIVFAVEKAQRQAFAPDKVNLASLGNQTPHLHWHVMPRWQNDPWFPDSIWSPLPAQDSQRVRAWDTRRQQIAALHDGYVSLLCNMLSSTM